MDSDSNPQCRFTALTNPAAISLPSGEESCFHFGLALGCIGDPVADSTPVGVTYTSGVGAWYSAMVTLSPASVDVSGDGGVTAGVASISHGSNVSSTGIDSSSVLASTNLFTAGTVLPVLFVRTGPALGRHQNRAVSPVRV